MKDEAIEINKGIEVVNLNSTVDIFICLRLIDTNYNYKLK